MTATLPTVVSTAWLAAELGAADLRVLDGTWHMPQLRRDARAEFAQGHIPGAVFFDIDAIADRTTTLPHMLPTPEAFAEAVGALGIGSDDRVVVYDVRGGVVGGFAVIGVIMATSDPIFIGTDGGAPMFLGPMIMGPLTALVLKKLDVPHVRMKPGRYASELRKLVRTHEPKRKLDLMIVHALIEARSCERFRLLAKHLPPEARDLYQQLERSEARHFEIYLDFAAREFDAAEISSRLQVIASRESELATQPDRELRFHSGPP